MNRVMILLAAVAVTMTAGSVWADLDDRQISVTGQGQVAAAPDMATITLGVTNEAVDAAEAMAATSQAVGKILARLDQMGLAPSDVQTQQFSLNPVWSNDNRTPDAPSKITGFQASNSVMVRIRDLDRLGDVLDAVIADGANNFNGLQFGVQDPQPLMDAARKAAVLDAMARAGQLADAAQVTLGPVLTITEQGGRSMPMAMSAARDSSVPIAAGEVTIEASVSMVFMIAK